MLFIDHNAAASPATALPARRNRDAHTKAGQLAQEKIGPLTQQGPGEGNDFTQMFGGN